jgi:hypothetical protein
MTIRTFAAGTMTALVLGAGAATLGGCAKPADSGAADQSSVQQAIADSDTIDLVDATVEAAPALADQAGQQANQQGDQQARLDRRALRVRLLRALHGTWVTQGQNGTVTHQAIRGEVTAVSATSITVRAKDGFSLTFGVSKDTTVRSRAAGKGSASNIGAVKVGSKALVTGVGATNPSARLVVFHSGTPQPSSSPSPSATS